MMQVPVPQQRSSSCIYFPVSSEDFLLHCMGGEAKIFCHPTLDYLDILEVYV
jgi:hypothetical protein